MFSKIITLLSNRDQPSDAGSANPLHLATAALLVEVALADGHGSDQEFDHLKKGMKAQFNLSVDQIDPLIDEARSAVDGATDFYKFTRVISKELDQDGRQEIVKLLWQMALADNHLDNIERNAVGKISGLLGVRAADQVRLRQEVEKSQGLDAGFA